MNTILYYDYCAFFLIVVIGIYIIRRNRLRTERNRISRILLDVLYIATSLDIIRLNLDIYAPSLIRLRFALHSVFFFFQIMIALAFILYIVSITETWHVLRRHLALNMLTVVPAVILVILLWVNFDTQILFSVGADGSFVMNSGMMLIYAITALYFALTIVYLTVFRNMFTTSRFVSLLFPVPICSIALGIQFSNPTQRIMMFVLSICYLELILINRRAENVQDMLTGFSSGIVLDEFLKAAIISKRKVKLILVSITNYRAALHIGGYDDVGMIVKVIAQEIETITDDENIRAGLYYYGEGHFAITVSEKYDDRVELYADRILTRLDTEVKLYVADLELITSVSVVNCPEEVESMDTLHLLTTDLDEFGDGRRVLKASDYTNREEFILKKEMNAIIDRAIMEGHLYVYYQPIYSTKDGRFKSAEALIRLKDPEHGFVSPGLFIPLAEKSGAIHRIGSFVLEEVCAFIGSPEFDKLGVDYIEINLSAMQCLRSNLTEELRRLSEKYCISPSQVNLEITETAAGYSQSRLIKNIDSLHELGFSISLDDFGTGYSNMMRIASLPLSIVKLDRAFVIMEEEPDFRVILKNLIEMFKDMNLHVLVEGIETKKLADDFINFGVDYIQGYYYAKPMPKEDYIKFLKQHLHAS